MNYFMGCIFDYKLHNTGKNVIKVLVQIAVDALVLHREVSCLKQTSLIQYK